MITRRASEIIRLALTMSQINNTDALSWCDKLDMLNQSYVRLYEDFNNSGDIYYCKEMVIENAINERGYKLPKDFWKLLPVGHESTFGEITPIERAPNFGQYSGYRIINNELVIPNDFQSERLVVKYIPQPQTITYPRPGYKLAGKHTQAAYDSLNDVIVLGGNGVLTVINNSSGRTINRFSEDHPVLEGIFILAASAGIIYIVTDTGITCFDYEFNQISSLEGTFDLYAHSIGWEEGIIVRSGNRTFRYISGSELIESIDYWNFMNGIIHKSISEGITMFTYEDESIQEITEIFEGADSFIVADPYIYINKLGSVTVYEEFEPTDIARAIIGHGSRKGIVLAAEANNESGYGVIFRDFYSGLFLLGYAADTVLNYPQNIFFDWLTVDLAVKFRIALDIPTGELPALAADYHDILMKGLSRDVYQNQRISNAYGRAHK